MMDGIELNFLKKNFFYDEKVEWLVWPGIIMSKLYS